MAAPGIASFLPHLPASGCDPGPCVPMTPATSFYGPGAAVAGGVVLEVICIIAEPCGAIELIDIGIAGTAAAGIAFLTRHQNSRAKPSDQECHRIVEQAKNTCTDNYVKGLVSNVGQWRACVRTIVEPTGCDF